MNISYLLRERLERVNECHFLIILEQNDSWNSVFEKEYNITSVTVDSCIHEWERIAFDASSPFRDRVSKTSPSLLADTQTKT